jgi:hypothetical protein
MRKWASVAAVVVAAVASPTTALAEGPPEVYSDFAEDGVLSCGHSRAALKDTLNDASIHQYGDPFTFIGLKLAVRKQLVGGCRRGRSERSSSVFAVSGDSVPAATESRPSSTRPSPGKATSRPRRGQREREPVTPTARAGISTGSGRDGRMVLLGVVLLLLTLGCGGWAARRAFTDQR